jgi:hypothetical protein
LRWGLGVDKLYGAASISQDTFQKYAAHSVPCLFGVERNAPHLVKCISIQSSGRLSSLYSQGAAGITIKAHDRVQQNFPATR